MAAGGAQPPDLLVEDVVQVHVLGLHFQAAVVCLGQSQQVLHEVAHAGCFLGEDVLHLGHIAPVGSAAAISTPALEGGQRAAQFVAGVRDEPALFAV